MKKTLKLITVGSLILFLLLVAFAKVKRVTPLSWDHNRINQPMLSNEAINGYDPVSYFTEGKAVKGISENSMVWKNASWSFSSPENMRLFKDNPEKYTPQFGGFCAFAVNKGFTADTDPEVFDIVDGKLYLFANESIKTSYRSNLDQNIASSNTNWNQ